MQSRRLFTKAMQQQEIAIVKDQNSLTIDYDCLEPPFFLDKSVFISLALGILVGRTLFYGFTKNRLTIPSIAEDIFIALIFYLVFSLGNWGKHRIKKLKPSDGQNTIQFAESSRNIALGFFINTVHQYTGAKNEKYLMPMFEDVLEVLTKENTKYVGDSERNLLRILAKRRSIQQKYPNVMQGIINGLYYLHTDEDRKTLQALATEKPRKKNESWIPQAAQQCLDTWHDKYW
jgi:hypothetical protein